MADWSSIYESSVASSVGNMLKSPNRWKIVLADRVRELTGSGGVLEAGCGYGLTSLLVGEMASRVLLDIEPRALDVSKALFEHADQRARHVLGNLFHMPFDDGEFEVVFNAGVLEHFAFDERREALREMTRVTKPGGCIVAAVPNHFSAPYAHAYKTARANGTWKYPDEQAIYDFSAEFGGISGVRLVGRETCDLENSFSFLTNKKIRIWFRLLNILKPFEGYLTICTYQRASDE